MKIDEFQAKLRKHLWNISIQAEHDEAKFENIIADITANALNLEEEQSHIQLEYNFQMKMFIESSLRFGLFAHNPATEEILKINMGKRTNRVKVDKWLFLTGLELLDETPFISIELGFDELGHSCPIRIINDADNESAIIAPWDPDAKEDGFEKSGGINSDKNV